MLQRSKWLVLSLAGSICFGFHNFSHGSDSLSELRLATFDVDATPPVGFMMAYDPVRKVDELELRARGIVICGAGDPIVLCAVDWIGIGNESQDVFRQRLATAAGTTPARVAVHALHQHDAPHSDFSAERLLHEAGATDLGPHEGSFARELLHRLDDAVAQSMLRLVNISHVGVGVADVVDVASNRRILGEDGKVRVTRYTATSDPAVRAEPVGTIDPQLTAISFWNDESPVAVLTYYACHPQSYYRTGIPSPDFPGIARFMRGQDLPEALHVHFNGAGGNIGAGKYNDGAKENRMILAGRVAAAMRHAFETTNKFAVTGLDVGWESVPVALPPARHLDRDQLAAKLAEWKPNDFFGPSDKLAWLIRCQRGQTIDVGCLRLGQVRVLHMPGELFVEYQLAAKAMRPDLTVAMAAYGDYGPGYIGTEAAYREGGYETSEQASHVDPTVERVLHQAMLQLLGAKE